MTRSEKATWILKFLQANPIGMRPIDLGLKMGFSRYNASGMINETLNLLIEGGFIERFYLGSRSCYRMKKGDPMFNASSIKADYVTEYVAGEKKKYFWVVATMKSNTGSLSEFDGFDTNRKFSMIFSEQL